MRARPRAPVRPRARGRPRGRLRHGGGFGRGRRSGLGRGRRSGLGRGRRLRGSRLGHGGGCRLGRGRRGGLAHGCRSRRGRGLGRRRRPARRAPGRRRARRARRGERRRGRLGRGRAGNRLLAAQVRAGVLGLAVAADLDVHVRTGARPAAADVADRLPGLHVVARRHLRRRQMRVARRHRAGVADAHHEAVAVALVGGLGDRAALRGVDGRAARRGDVQPGMGVIAPALAVAAGDRALHRHARRAGRAAVARHGGRRRGGRRVDGLVRWRCGLGLRLRLGRRGRRLGRLFGGVGVVVVAHDDLDAVVRGVGAALVTVVEEDTPVEHRAPRARVDGARRAQPVLALEGGDRCARDRPVDAVGGDRELALDGGDRVARVAEAQQLGAPVGGGRDRRRVDGRGGRCATGAAPGAGERGDDRRGEHGGADGHGGPAPALAVAAARLEQAAPLARALERLLPQVERREVAVAARVRVQVRWPGVHVSPSLPVDRLRGELSGSRSEVRYAAVAAIRPCGHAAALGPPPGAP